METKWNYDVPTLQPCDVKFIIFELNDDFRKSEDFKKTNFSCYYGLGLIFGHKKPFFGDNSGLLDCIGINEGNWKDFIKRWIDFEEVLNI